MTQKPLKAPAVIAIANGNRHAVDPGPGTDPARASPPWGLGEVLGWVWQSKSPENWPWDGGGMIAAHTPDKITCYTWEDRGRDGGWYTYDLPLLESFTQGRTTILIGCPLIARFTPAGEEGCMKQKVFPGGEATIFRDALNLLCDQRMEAYVQIVDENDSLAIPPVKVICPPQD
ncbi:MAG: hypothetical protein F4Z75_03055 [Synechococcus sp. SB0668_bin_15]|nr:hypothetical protein [Synechococcus sp. SB0668_bin_15]MXZ82546.1 hypothetical protein [Synechococcus sp. SB0666_bin_14]MYA91538.1 hypothetical protein [Synechococcus sp. SB0663_bin_10]MYC50236.1 hypothetical protein [Synechococcus sp. SB0662_bin_14]MYG46720.1 hypothetical protein [Synechococcus sp. SB0675_bin_6]MYJ59884.1 hypothetical protein [Synechococcus sp. SB0672_bin_6]MYK91013.1 hypothetical protein [Synechococcus sp. SB0669_bin_8]